MITEKLILGTVQFGLDYGINNQNGKTPEEKIQKILDEAFSRGIRILDTAEAYGDSQNRIGNYHKSSTNRFDVVTKFCAKEEVTQSFRISDHILKDIAILEVDRLYAYMFHSFSDFKNYFEHFKEELLEMRSIGKIQKIGVSIYTNEELQEVLDSSEIELIQLPYNLLDNHTQRFQILRQAKYKGVEIHTRSAFLQGLFFKPLSTLSGNLLNLQKDLERLNDFCESENIDMATLALNYPMSKPYIDKVLIGVDTVEQLQQNIGAISSYKNTSLFEYIDQIAIENNKILNPSLWKV